MLPPTAQPWMIHPPAGQRPGPVKIWDPTIGAFAAPETVHAHILNTMELQRRKGSLPSHSQELQNSKRKFSVPTPLATHSHGQTTAISSGIALLGLAYSGGADNLGAIVSSDGDSVQNEFSLPFTNPGANPQGDPLVASNGKLYGMAYSGGANNLGVIFQYDPTTNTYTVLYNFDGTNGEYPYGSLIELSPGKFYGMTEYGGLLGYGVIFEYDDSTSTYTVQYSFDGTNGGYPIGSLIQASNGKLYGVAGYGGLQGYGVIFEYDDSTNTYTKKYDFDYTHGGYYYYYYYYVYYYYGQVSLIEVSPGNLYGMTPGGGANGYGVLFEYDDSTNTYTDQIDFNGANGAIPSGSLIRARDGNLYGLTEAGGLNRYGVIFQYNDSTNIYTDKYDFDYTNGAGGYGSLIQASNGKLYGMSNSGGANSGGVLFEYDDSANTYAKLYDLNSANGDYPDGSLIQASNGKLYGMTQYGGLTNNGVILEYDIIGNVYTAKINFNDVPNGTYPFGSLCKASNGKYYGLTDQGGANNNGVLFEYDDSTNTYTKKFDFGGANGANPQGSVIQASNGKLYGMTYAGGVNGYGVLFEYDDSTNTCTKKYDFDGTNGAYPYGSPIQATNGKLYGMTYEGGANSVGVLFEYDDSTNTYTKKYDFDYTNGGYPAGSLIQATNGKLYGLTFTGGANGGGVIFEFDDSTTTYTVKYVFDNTNGGNPFGSLVQGNDNKFYGMTYNGGATSVGVLFEYDDSTNTYAKKLDFGGTNGNSPRGSLIQATNGKLYGMTNGGGTNGVGVIFEYDRSTNTYRKVGDFNSALGVNPRGDLVEVTFTITATSGNKGSISPSGTVTVNYGGSPRFTFPPRTGYHADSIIVDGTKIDSTAGYTFNNVITNHTIRVTFKLNPVVVGVNSRWNLISVPLQLKSYQTDTLFPSAITPAYAYKGGYVPEDTLVNGIGYWLKFNTAEIISFTGIQYLQDTIPIINGWNLIGSISLPVPANAIGSIPDSLVTSQLFGYNNGYTVADTVQPGKGYWIKTIQAGKLILSSTDAGSTALAKVSNHIRRILTGTPPPPPESKETSTAIPTTYMLDQNYPNPFNPTTSIQYALPEAAYVTLKIYNVLGQEVVTLVNAEQSAGYKSVQFNASNFPSGVYMYRLKAGSYSAIKKLLLIK